MIANKVVASTIRIDDLANQLKVAYRTLFTFAGQGAGSSRLKLYTDEIEKKLLEFDGYLANLDRVREKVHVDLASVESQNQMHRRRALSRAQPDPRPEGC